MGQLRESSKRSGRWTKGELVAGFNHFKDLNGRFPTAHEIDVFPYLPTARSIQRSFGGLVNVRKELFPLEIANYTKGLHRSGVAKQTYANGRSHEETFYTYLIKHFPEIAVHEHKVIRPGRVNSDFFIYLDEHIGVVIDIFYAENIINLINVVNIKLKRYSLIIPETYLVVVGNPSITQEAIDKKVMNRRVPLMSHISIASEDYFKTTIVTALKKRTKYGLKPEF